MYSPCLSALSAHDDGSREILVHHSGYRKLHHLNVIKNGLIVGSFISLNVIKHMEFGR